MKWLDKAFYVALVFVLALTSSFPIDAETKASIVDAGKRATISDLERLLSKFGRRADSATTVGGKVGLDTSVKASDDQMQAVEIEFLVLTERLTPWTRERLERTYRLGPQGFDALERVADLSALEAPPANELAPDPVPDAGEQRRIFEAALTAGLDGLRKVPPYSVESITEYYNNGYVLRTDQNMVSDMIHSYKHKWQGIGPWISTFSVQEGRESADRNGPVTPPGRLPKPPNFESWGEFSARPSLILGDITPENLHFLRWEKSPSGLLAVFHYTVPAENSHYRVDASCGKNKPFHSLPAYQGTISIDPQTGAILRLTMDATAQKKDPVFDVAAAIEYGPVRLGDTEANLPIRSLTFMTEDPNVCLGTKGGLELASGGVIMLDYLPTRRYNRTLFTDFKPPFLEAENPTDATTQTSSNAEAPTNSFSAKQSPLPVVLNLAQELISVAELEQRLDRLNRENRKQLHENASASQSGIRDAIADEEMAHSISELELTERLDTSQQQRLKQQFHLGPQSSAALELLADLSALREPPSAQLVRNSAPNEDTQKHMLQIARDTSATELAHLPNFFARRDTLRFAGELKTKPDTRGTSWLPINDASQNSDLISLKSSTSLRITYRDGREVIDKAVRIDRQSNPTDNTRSGRPNDPDLASLTGEGLSSWGEFGSELVAVLTDAQNGSIQFQAWETGPTGLQAVFRFEVPQNASHYQVSSDCAKDGPFHAVPAYRGTMALDAETSRVVRLEVQTSSQDSDPISGIASVVEYGPVQIGDKWFNRPLRSLVFLTLDPAACVSASMRTMHQPPKTSVLRYLPIRQLNRTTFSDYHRLGSTYRIVSEPQDIQ